MKADIDCITCCHNKAVNFLKQYQGDTDTYTAAMNQIDCVLDQIKKKGSSAPVIMAAVMEIIKETLQLTDVYKDIKQKYNHFLLNKEEQILDTIRKQEDCFLAALQYAITGNYIDFGAMSDVDDEKLEELLNNWSSIQLDDAEVDNLKGELERAKKILYITDNAGEIVLDKVFIIILKQLYPDMEIGVLVRGRPILNDATIEDAESIGLTRLVHVLDNGNGIPGTVLENITKEAKEWIETSDLCIAKGQGNFETLHGCGENIYYLFLCKCELFVKKFGVPRFSPVLNNELRLIENK